MDWNTIISNSDYLSNNLEKCEQSQQPIFKPNCQDFKLFSKIIRLLLDLVKNQPLK